MNTNTIITIAAAGLLAVPGFAEEATPQVGDILESINMFSPEEEDPSYKVKAHERYGSQWGVDMAYGFWSTNHAASGANRHNNYALLHAQVNQRFIEDNENGGTWLRAELSGSWALDQRTASRHDGDFVSAMGTATDVHGDIFGQHNAVIPELALMHYFNGKRACIIAGMVNLTNYFDAVGIANDSFSNFANTGFMNSTVLPLVDSNLGVVAQAEISRKDYVMGAVSRTDTESGYDPFNTTGSGYCIIGEYGHIFADGKVITRLNPFYQHIAANEEGISHQTAGLAGSVEWAPTDNLSLYSRIGWAAKQQYGASFDFSVGANIKLIPSREDDFLGIAYGIFKGANDRSSEETSVVHRREQALEIMYSFQVNDWLKIVPHVEYIHNPAYQGEGAHRDETVIGAQTVFSF